MLSLKTVFKQNTISSKKIIIVVSALLFQIIISVFIIYAVTIYQVRQQLDKKITHAQEDLHYVRGVWDMTRYNNDPLLLGVYPLYVITTDGFVLDRRDPIHDFLNTSDYHRLLSYTHTSTVKTIANQKRRIYSQPIYDRKQIIGVIAVSYFNPKSQLLNSIDENLISTLNKIKSEITIKNGVIDTSKIDQRAIPYDISFTIVDSYNTIVTKTANVNNIDRITNFIDPSYVKEQIESPKERIIQDSQTGEIFLTETVIIKDKDKQPIGFIIIGKSLQSLFMLLENFAIWQTSFTIVLILLVWFLIPWKENQSKTTKEKLLIHISFNETKGILLVNENEISIPYATNQFYMLQALFKKPTKRWETDELLKKFGEDETAHSRKVYDTMVKINNKVTALTSQKLILNQNKTYRLNPKIILTS